MPTATFYDESVVITAKILPCLAEALAKADDDNHAPFYDVILAGNNLAGNISPWIKQGGTATVLSRVKT